MPQTSFVGQLQGCQLADIEGAILSFLIKNFFLIYLCLAALRLHCCAHAFSTASGDYSVAAVHRLLMAVVSLVAEHKL